MVGGKLAKTDIFSGDRIFGGCLIVHQLKKYLNPHDLTLGSRALRLSFFNCAPK